MSAGKDKKEKEDLKESTREDRSGNLEKEIGHYRHDVNRLQNPEKWPDPAEKDKKEEKGG